ncbi:MAG: glycosyltransferase [Chitinophagaceae bacterium]|nr:glycosyltransferase [Chitinophagaceae bacterium]
MKISIITASFNSAGTITDTLQSVATQTYTDIEHIIVDGASQDATLQIVSRYGNVAKVLSEKDNGIYDAMNKGIRLASGSIVGILNSDDFYVDPFVIEQVMKLFENDSVDAVYGDLQYVDASNTAKVVRTWKAGTYNQRSFYNGWMPPHPTFFVRKSLYDRFGVFNLELRTAADYEIILRFLVKHQIKATYLPKIVVRMRTGGASNSSIKQRLKANREDRRAWEINGLHPTVFTLILKPLRKINQFIIK